MLNHSLPFALLTGSIAVCNAFHTPTFRQSHVVTVSNSFPLFAKAPKVEKSEEEWKEILNPQQFDVLRKEGTESAWSSSLNEVKEDGTFRCAGCGAALFTTSTKFESGSGWPSFYDPIDGEAVNLSVDYKLIMPRTEVTCKSCEGHLGHVFEDGPRPTGKRYCMNGAAMNFISDEDNPDLAKMVEKRSSGAGQVKQPLMTVLPSLVFDSGIAVLFINSFFSKNGNNGLALISDGSIRIGQLLEFIPLGVGIFYAASALKRAVALFLSSQD